MPGMATSPYQLALEAFPRLWNSPTSWGLPSSTYCTKKPELKRSDKGPRGHQASAGKAKGPRGQQAIAEKAKRHRGHQASAGKATTTTPNKARVSDSGKSMLVGNIRIHLQSGRATIEQDQVVLTMPTRNSFQALEGRK
ncbi:hypothetical protein Taro_042318 [Colocasia esculenta]|uniref:Uncharacterized protein n=1 Tax=Colocasia esculenta TaxID=4460 RepID=A0A843WP92_COLES|nr:hypothetical protein [Colocasia esculenta]